MFGVDDLLIGTLVGGIGSGLISTAGQIYTNKTNTQNVKNTNNTNYQIAALNNATQVDLSNTAHQREVADLEAAGLNPILSAGGNGAVTPSLTSTRMDSAQIENPANGIASSAKSLGRYISGLAQLEMDSMKSSNQLQEDQSDLVRLETDKGRYNLQNIDQRILLEREKLKYQTEFARLENKALHDLAYDKVNERYGGKDHVSYKLNERSDGLYSDVKRGILSDAQLRASGFMRGLVDSAATGISSAATLGNLFVPKGRKRK